MNRMMQDQEAEKALLGGLLSNPGACDAAAEILHGPGDFASLRHQIIYRQIQLLAEAGERPDPVTVNAALQREGQSAKTGGGDYLHTLMAACPLSSQVPSYARIVRDHALRRSLDAAGQEIGKIAAEADPADILVLADQVFTAAMSAGARPTSDAAPIGADWMDYLDRLEHPRDPGLSTGLADLDAITAGGLRGGQLVMIGARTSVGKSVLLTQIAAHSAIRLGVPTLLVNLEMSRREIQDRITANLAGIQLRSLQTAALNEHDWQRIAYATRDIAESPLLISDSPSIGVAKIRATVRDMRRRGTPLGLIAIDYIQLMRSPGRRAENRQQELSDLCRSLKLLARDSDVPVLVAAQLNRGPETRVDKRPQMADLRESGSLEQDSDIVILLHREDAYAPMSPRAGEIDLIVAKQRGGPTGTITAAFQGHYARIADMARV